MDHKAGTEWILALLTKENVAWPKKCKFTLTPATPNSFVVFCGCVAALGGFSGFPIIRLREFRVSSGEHACRELLHLVSWTLPSNLPADCRWLHRLASLASLFLLPALILVQSPYSRKNRKVKELIPFSRMLVVWYVYSTYVIVIVILSVQIHIISYHIISYHCFGLTKINKWQSAPARRWGTNGLYGQRLLPARWPGSKLWVQTFTDTICICLHCGRDQWLRTVRAPSAPSAPSTPHRVHRVHRVHPSIHPSIHTYIH